MEEDKMPEKVTKEEAIIRQTVEQLRLVKQLIQQENEVNLPYDDDMEEVKVKRPKYENDNTKIENNKDTHSGYGLAGEESEFKKAVDPKEDVTLSRQLPQIRGLNIQVALKILEEAGKLKLTKAELNRISKSFQKAKAMSSSELQTRMAILEGLEIYSD